MENNESFTAAIAVIVIFGLPVVWAISARWMAHQERMAMISRGMAPPVDRDLRRMYRQGFVPPPGEQMGYDAYGTWRAQRSLRAGVVLTMVGFALLIGLFFINVGHPGPWLLGGLIPMFCGIAQIVNGLLCGARLNIAGPIPMAGPPAGAAGPEPPKAPFGAPPPQPDPGPYAWRPGGTPELHRPPSPPDAR